jgi:hypothetical protein
VEPSWSPVYEIGIGHRATARRPFVGGRPSNACAGNNKRRLTSSRRQLRSAPAPPACNPKGVSPWSTSPPSRSPGPTWTSCESSRPPGGKYGHSKGWKRNRHHLPPLLLGGAHEPAGQPQRPIRKAIELGAEKVGVETDQGGDTWEIVYRQALREVLDEIEAADPTLVVKVPKFDEDKAGAGHGGKVERSNKMLADYERGGRSSTSRARGNTLARALHRFPKTKPFGLADAAYWSWADLRSKAGRLASASSTIAIRSPRRRTRRQQQRSPG